MKGTTNAQRNAVVGSSSAVDKLTLTMADGTTQQHTVSDMIPKDTEPTTGSAKFVTSGAVKTALDEKVDKVDGKQLSTEDYTNIEKNKLAGISAGAQVNVIEEIQLNGAKITPSSKAVNIDLSSYATKGDLSAIPKFTISVVSSLPTSDISTSTIYLLSNGGSSGNSYDEYLYVNGAWEKIGTTEVDLSGYVPTTRTVNNKQLNTNITLTAGDVGALPADGTAVKATADANGNNIANTYATQTALTNGLAAKQNALTFDSAPTSGSSNPVTSGGVFSAINEVAVSSVSGEVNENNELVITVNGVSGAGIPLPEGESYIFGQYMGHNTLSIELKTYSTGSTSTVNYSPTNATGADYINNIFPMAIGNPTYYYRVAYVPHDQSRSESDNQQYYIQTSANSWYTMSDTWLLAYKVSKTGTIQLGTGYVLVHNIRGLDYVWSGFNYLLDAIIDLSQRKVKFSKPVKSRSGKIAGYKYSMNFNITDLSYAEYFETDPGFE